MDKICSIQRHRHGESVLARSITSHGMKTALDEKRSHTFNSMLVDFPQHRHDRNMKENLQAADLNIVILTDANYAYNINVLIQKVK